VFAGGYFNEEAAAVRFVLGAMFGTGARAKDGISADNGGRKDCV
jgi:hypothetical protein